MPQLSYSIDTAPVAFPGQPVDIAASMDAVTALASVAIPYGCLVVRDSAASFDKIVGKLPTVSTDVTAVGKAIGVAMADQARAQDPSVAVATYPALSAVPCLKKRRIWVLVEEAVTAGDSVFVRFAAGAGGTQLGAFRKSADTATAAALPGALYVANAAAAGYAVVELNLA